MQSASPEPSRDRAHEHATGTATEGQADAPSARHRVRVTDEQTHPVDLVRVDRLARHVLTAMAVPEELELSVTCIDAQRIRQLNRVHMDADRPTDVLAFPIDAPVDAVSGVPGLLGDVVVCPSVAADQAGANHRTPQSETDLLVVHGILHLLGHDHATRDERAQMFGLTDTLLAQFGGDQGAEP